MMKLLKLCKYLLKSLIILFVFCVIIIMVVSKTTMGTEYFFKVVPGLMVEGTQGSLSGGWSAKKLTWQDDDIKVIVVKPQLDWSISCLLRANVCIDRLVAEQVIIETSTSTPKTAAANNNSSAPLPSLNLPISINLNKLILNELVVDQQTLVNHLDLSELYWQNAVISFKQLSLAHQDLVIAHLNGQITLQDHWPLDIHAQLNLNHLQNEPWTADTQITGQLQQQLTIQLNSKGFLQANALIKLIPLDETLPADITLNIDNFLPKHPDIPESLRIKKLNLEMKGTLSKGYHLKTNGTFAGVKKPINLNIKGLIKETSAQIEALTLYADKQQTATIKGTVNLQPDLHATMHLDWQHFPWQELYPEESIPIDVQKMQARIDYSNDSYQAILDAALQGPAGNFDLTSKVTGNLKQITLESLQLKTKDNGAISGNATISLNPSIEWLGKLHVTNLNPNYGLADLSGKLNGTVDTQGSILDHKITTHTTVDIKGHLRKQNVLLKAQITAKQSQWHMPELLLHFGNNQIKGNGKFAKQLQANLQLNLANLKQLLPELSGNLNGTVQLAGSIKSPQGSINLVGKQLGYDDQKIAQLKLTGSVNDKQQGFIKLQLNRIKLANLNLGNLIFTSEGNIDQQNTELKLSGGAIQLQTMMNSRLNQQKNWISSINQFIMTAANQTWKLQKPAMLTLTNDQLALSSHCFQSDKTTLCAVNSQQFYPEPSINYQLNNFQLEHLKPLLPKDFSWSGLLNAHVEIKLPKTGPKGVVEITTNAGMIKVRDSAYDTWVDFPYKSLQLSAQLHPKNIVASLQFDGNQLGKLQTDITIDPFTASKAISGNFKISQLNISVFKPFIENLRELKGIINGSGKITGSLIKPQISGKVTLTNGHAIGDIPVTIENMQLTALINGESADIQGHWTSGKQGSASLTGHASWNEKPDISLQLKTQKIPIFLDPYGQVETNTDLTVAFKDQTVNLKGNIVVPTGAIVVRALPPSAVSVSSDAIIIGQKAESKTPIKLNMDLKILLGTEKLTFSGFGLNTDIIGTLHITKDLFTQGEVNLKNGIYNAYGQHLKIRRAIIMFTGSATNPALDIEAIRSVEDVTAGLRVTGLATNPQVTVFSEPSMSQEQALSYIVFGKPLEAENNNFVVQMLVALGTSGSASTLGNIADTLGIKDFQLDTDSTGSDTKVIASGKLTDTLSVHYRYDVFAASDTLMLRYLLTKKVYIEVATGTANSIDVIYKRSF